MLKKRILLALVMAAISMAIGSSNVKACGDFCQVCGNAFNDCEQANVDL